MTMADTKFTGTSTYVATDDLMMAVNAAVTLERPILIKGEPGTGKTQLAVEIAESLDHQTADLFGGHFADLLRGDGGFHCINDREEISSRHRSFLAGAKHAVEELLAVKALAPAVTLDHRDRQLINPLVGCEPTAAIGALAASAYLYTFAHLARVHDPARGVAAERTDHSVSPSSANPRTSEKRIPSNGRQRSPITVMGTKQMAW